MCNLSFTLMLYFSLHYLSTTTTQPILFLVPICSILLEESINIIMRPATRPSYRCSRCGEPKKGHECIFQQRVSQVLTHTVKVDATTQAEIDPTMTVRELRLTTWATKEDEMRMDK